MSYVFPTTSEITNYVRETLLEIRDEVKTEFEFDVKSLKVEINFKSGSKRIGLGGLDKNFKPFIRLTVGDLLSREVVAFSEYPALSKYSAIGSFYTNDWKMWIRALILHELSHAIQMTMIFNPKQFSFFKPVGSYLTFGKLGVSESNHGSFFRNIYYILRNKFLNAHIERSHSYIRNNFKVDETTVAKAKVSFGEAGQHIRTSLGMLVVGETKLRIAGTNAVFDGYKPSNHKYPFLIKINGKRYKAAKSQLTLI